MFCFTADVPSGETKEDESNIRVGKCDDYRNSRTKRQLGENLNFSLLGITPACRFANDDREKYENFKTENFSTFTYC